VNTKEDILKNVGNQIVYGPHWLPWYIFFFSILWKSMRPINFLITHILQNIHFFLFVFCGRKKII